MGKRTYQCTYVRSYACVNNTYLRYFPLLLLCEYRQQTDEWAQQQKWASPTTTSQVCKSATRSSMICLWLSFRCCCFFLLSTNARTMQHELHCIVECAVDDYGFDGAEGVDGAVGETVVAFLHSWLIFVWAFCFWVLSFASTCFIIIFHSAQPCRCCCWWWFDGVGVLLLL